MATLLNYVPLKKTGLHVSGLLALTLLAATTTSFAADEECQECARATATLAWLYEVEAKASVDLFDAQVESAELAATIRDLQGRATGAKLKIEDAQYDIKRLDADLTLHWEGELDPANEFYGAWLRREKKLLNDLAEASGRLGAARGELRVYQSSITQHLGAKIQVDNRVEELGTLLQMASNLILDYERRIAVCGH